MSKQDSKKEPMTAQTKNSGLWNTKIASASTGVGISASDLSKLSFESIQIQTEEVKARIKSFETPINREALNRVFK